MPRLSHNAALGTAFGLALVAVLSAFPGAVRAATPAETAAANLSYVYSSRGDLRSVIREYGTAVPSM